MKSTNPDISIIVPVHNAGKYLRECLDSLVHQTAQNIEIILVMDCPTDGSDEICREYTSDFDQIVLVENKENLHIGYSRNMGLSVARGKYVAFSDHDDFRELDMYEKLIIQAEVTQSEIVFGMPVTSKNGQIEVSKSFDNKQYTNEELLEDLISGGDDITNTPIVANIHPNLYLRNFLISNNIQFTDTRTTTPEDRIFQIQCLIKSKSISFLNDVLYFHVIHDESSGKNFSYLSCSTRSKGKLLVYNILKNENCWEVYQNNFYNATKKELSNCLIDEFWQHKNIFRLYKEVQKYKSNEIFRLSFTYGKNNLSHYRIGGKLFRKLIELLMRN